MHDPTTPAEWQEAVDMAEAWQLIDSARQYGLVSGGPKIDAARCEELLSLGRARGAVPRRLNVNRIIAAAVARGGQGG